MRKVFADPSKELTEREKQNTALAREAAREGFVLLQNKNGALPLQEKKIALYGIGARKTIKGGTGSGAVNERHSVNIEEGLKNAGFQITTAAWLDDYDKEYEESYAAWKEYVDEQTKGRGFHEIMITAAEKPFRYPAGRLIHATDVEQSQTDTAIYVLARQAGEGHDRMDEAGDYRLTDIEYENLKRVAKAYTNTILVINIGGFCDLTFLDEISGIDAVVHYTQGGMEGGNALADVLSGAYNFSGKLSSSWAKKYADYPCHDTFSHMNGNLEDEDYREGIYVGYRYFDTFQKQVEFPFGFGRSYTDFKITTHSTVAKEGTIEAEIDVQNIGNKFSGKEVVQLYLECPRGKLPKEKKRLVAFKKTKELAPGEVQTLQVSFTPAQMESYSEEQAAWVVEKGEYLLSLGEDSNHTKGIALLVVDKDVVASKCQSCCAPEVRISEMEAPPVIESQRMGVERICISEDMIRRNSVTYKEPEVIETPKEKELLDELSPLEMAELLRGGGIQTQGQHDILGASGKTCITLGDRGIGNIVCADGPAGLNIICEITIEENGEEKPAVVPKRYQIGAMAEMAKHMLGKGTPYFRYATAWPAHILLAQTWNTELVQKVGEGVGREMLDFGVTLWLAPGMNIHRNPLCGRNFEYFSEDPLLTGKMAAAITKGVQSKKGVGVTLKHFACNNQENNRAFVSSNINERALREIYLKGFEIAVRESKPKGIMTSYNKINHVFNANNYDLCTKLLRMEWGFDGLVMTDWGGNADPSLGAVAGNDLMMPGTQEDKEAIAKGVEDNVITASMLRRAAARVLHVVLSSNLYQ